jgi:hypothetical protein
MPKEYEPRELGWLRMPGLDTRYHVCYEMPDGRLMMLRADLPQRVIRYDPERRDEHE